MNGPAELMKQLSANISTMTALVGILGGNAAAASSISGSSDKRSSEYKAALRSVQRYQVAEKKAAGAETKAKQGRGGVKGAAKLKAIRKAQANKLKKKSLTAEAPGEIWISQDFYHRNVRGFPEGTALPAADVDKMLDAFVDNKPDDAFAAFEHGIMDSYGMPNSYYNDDKDIDDLYLEWS